MDYEPRLFDLAKLGGKAAGDDNVAFAWREGKQTQTYLFSPRVRLAVNIALATGRPLLVSGEPGSGKTTLAKAVARASKRQYYTHTVTSRTQASDLLWTYDALRRLNDATTQGRKLLPVQHYVTPGAVWWGFDPKSAAERGLTPIKPASARAADPGGSGGTSAVVLVDEIDKADPDVPNDLLEPFDIQQFTVKETNDRIVAQRDVFLVLTTNIERELPPAFLRRCVMLTLDKPDAAWFVQVAARHFPGGDQALHERLADAVMALRKAARTNQIREPSTAEFLDAVRVCRELSLDERAKVWDDVVKSVLLKTDRQRDDKSKQDGANG